MSFIKRLVGASLALGIVASAPAIAESDSLRSMLEDSRTQQKGLTFVVGGQQIAGVVISVTDKYVVAKSQAQGNIVIRLDRIDGVSGFVSLGSISK